MSHRRPKSKRSKSPRVHGESKVTRESETPAAPSHFALKWWALFGLAIVAGGVGTILFRNQSRHTAESVSAEANPSSRVAVSESTDIDEPLALLTTASIKAEQAVSSTQLDPSQDGWETEVVAEQAKKLLLHLGERLAGHDLGDILPTEVSAEVTSGQLRPADLTEVFSEGIDDKGTVVRRNAIDDERAALYQGREGLKQAFDDLAKPLAGAYGVHVHVKIIRISSTATSAETTAYFEAGGRTSTGSLQQRATWHCQWERASQEKLRLTSIRASDYEEVFVTGPWLVDCTKAILSRNRSFREQLAFGHHHWLSRLSKAHGISVFTRSGMAVGDVNGDGRDDVYVCQPGGLPNRLFVQQPDSTAIDRSHESGVDWLDHTSSALVVDLDNDGDQDLIAATTAGLLVMENDGSGKFRHQVTLATQDTDTQSFSAVDYDHDGDLDLYICIEFANNRPVDGAEFVYHDANDGAANLLFRNDIAADGKWQFTDVTRQVGLDADNRRHSLACAWEDYDNDGDQDLYVANDYGQNCLYQNENGQFKNIAMEAGAVDSASGMSVSWGDYNRDGWMDIYVANMFSSAGNRITRQAQFMPGVDDETRNLYSRFAKGNTLLENDGHGQFREVGDSAGVEMGRWAWSSVFADLNNDSWEDLLVANGYITTEDSGDL
ncbi:MAG: VCBS repeat-containing protein [Pirellulales bacterium]